ncbi:hypothetical protein MMC22_009212 [Lobaria immixta]|nr:hypothetical protein [Lobaria immixta]
MKNLLMVCILALTGVSFAAPAPLPNALVVPRVESKPRGVGEEGLDFASDSLGAGKSDLGFVITSLG